MQRLRPAMAERTRGLGGHEAARLDYGEHLPSRSVAAARKHRGGVGWIYKFRHGLAFTPAASVVDDAQLLGGVEYRIYEIWGDVGENQEGHQRDCGQRKQHEQRYPPAEPLRLILSGGGFRFSCFGCLSCFGGCGGFSGFGFFGDFGCCFGGFGSFGGFDCFSCFGRFSCFGCRFGSSGLSNSSGFFCRRAVLHRSLHCGRLVGRFGCFCRGNSCS